MSNPWLTIPLEDYEGHMAMPDVGQAEMLANEFEDLLKTYAPSSAALIGCAGGNGFEKAAEAGVTRLVGLDLNPAYIAAATARYAGRMIGLELHCADIEGEMPKLQPVHMVYAALVFEYVDIGKALKNMRGMCLPNGNSCRPFAAAKGRSGERFALTFCDVEGAGLGHEARATGSISQGGRRAGVRLSLRKAHHP